MAPSVSVVDAVDLFSGAGGLAKGLTEGGLDVRLASDVWRPAADTYRANFPSHEFAQCDVRDLGTAEFRSRLTEEARWVLAGGPPCQGFSSAGARSDRDPRNTLVGFYATLAAQCLPDVFVFENVEGFLTAGNGRFVRDLLDPLIEAGYTVRLEKINVANFGVPQLRKRVIAIAARHRVPAKLTPTHSAFGSPGAWRVGQSLPPTKSVGEALARMGVAPGDPLSEAREPCGLELRRIQALGPGQTMRDLPDELQHSSWAARANRRVSDGTPSEQRGGAPIGLRRLIANEPSRAITGAATREFVHPWKNRTLTLREAAAIQTFPTDFQFLGTRNAVATLIGNAVPPLFARAIAASVIETANSPVDGGVTPGLIEFRVTNAEAMSPALQKVTAMVNQRYPVSEAVQGRLF
jgi:DNA (cytosine-5)-methyltransferase 1